MKAIKEFLKPNWWKVFILLITIFFVSSPIIKPVLRISNEPLTRGWPFEFYYETRKPLAQGKIYPFGLIIDAILYYLLACLIYLIFSKIQERKEKRGVNKNKIVDFLNQPISARAWIIIGVIYTVIISLLVRRIKIDVITLASFLFAYLAYREQKKNKELLEQGLEPKRNYINNGLLILIIIFLLIILLWAFLPRFL